MLTLGLVLYALIAKGQVPGRMPGVLFAVLAVRWRTTSWAAGIGRAWRSNCRHCPCCVWRLPHPDIGILRGFAAAADYLPLLLPFALLTVVGGVNNTESARVAGDDYDVRSILLGEAAATLAAGLMGGVAQTTPYIGHRAYKQMGAGAGYTLLTGLFIGLGGMLGFLSNLIELIPIAALAPVLVFIAIDITTQAFHAVPARHAPAIAVSFFPSIARMVSIELSNPQVVPAARLAQLLTMSEQGLPALAVILALGNGFIITATLWGAFVVELTERRLRGGSLDSHRGRRARLLRNHALGAHRRQRLRVVAARGHGSAGGDAVLSGLLHPGGGAPAAVLAA